MKKFKNILIIFIVFIVALGGCGKKEVEDPSSSGDSQMVEYGVAGYIVDLTVNENGSTLGSIRVEGPDNNGATYTEAVVSVTAETKIYENELIDFENLEEGMYVNVFFEGEVAESYPVQATAKQINVIPGKRSTVDDISEETPDEVSDNSDDIDGYPEVTRPETKEITTYPEGMEETNPYYLLNEENLPFTTYIRDLFHHELIEEEYGRGVTITLPESDMINMDIVFFNKDVSRDEALDHVNTMLENKKELQQSSEEDLADWEIASFSHSALSAEKFGSLSVGEYKDYLFYIYSYYAPEAGDGWYPFQQVIKEEWQWKETEERLIES